MWFLRKCLFYGQIFIIEGCHEKDFPELPLQTQIYIQQGPTLTKKCPTRSHFGGKYKFGGFYPKIMAYPYGLVACKIFKSDILLHVRVTQEDVRKQMLKFQKMTMK